MKKTYILTLIIGLFSSASIFAAMPVSSFIIRPERLSKDVYNQKESIFVISSEGSFSLPALCNQKIISEKTVSGRREITVATGNFSADTDQGGTKYLRDTPYLNLQSREIKETAAKFKKSQDPVKEISIFVYNHISDKKEGIPIIPALSILKDRAGDCTEHAVLTVSLLRAYGIPARAVVGIILSEYFANQRDVFVYHMWAEAYRNGKWELVDSTRPMNIRHNRYIGFTFHNLTTEAPIDYLNAISPITNIMIRQAE